MPFRAGHRAPPARHCTGDHPAKQPRWQHLVTEPEHERLVRELMASASTVQANEVITLASGER